MDKYTALELFTEQLKRELAEALNEIEAYKANEQLLLARLRKAESARGSKIICRR